MSETVALNAQKREGAGKGPARTLRRAGNIPAIIYGGKQPEVRISMNLRELTREYEKGHFTSKLIDLSVDGSIVRVIARSLQIDPVSDKPIHADFLRLVKGDKVRVFVPVKFINADKSPGLKRGGVLNAVRRDIEFSCEPEAIPQNIVVDLNDLQIGDSVHISHVKVPEGVTPTITDRDFTIATIVGRGASTGDEDGTTGATAGADATADASGSDSAKAPAAAKAAPKAPAKGGK